jgi:hypothetical protein
MPALVRAQLDGRTLDWRARPSLDALPRCAQMGAPFRGQCGGHWDYFGTFMVWTRHYRVTPTVRYKVVAYCQLAPEAVPTCP